MTKKGHQSFREEGSAPPRRENPGYAYDRIDLFVTAVVYKVVMRIVDYCTFTFCLSCLGHDFRLHNGYVQLHISHRPVLVTVSKHVFS